MNEMLEGYMEDLKENLICLNEALIDMEKGDRSQELINRIFRVAHTIKGNSAAMEFYNMEKVMHTMENILQEVRSGERQLTEKIIRILYTSHDFLEDCLVVLEKESSDKNVVITEILEDLKNISEANELREASSKAESKEQQDFEISSELKEVLLENLKRGFIPYEICVEIDAGCAMKTVRAWMVFEAISKYGTIISTVPEQLCEEAFAEGTVAFNDTVVKLLIITDREIEGMDKDLLALAEIEQVTIQEIGPKLIAQVQEEPLKEKGFKDEAQVKPESSANCNKNKASAEKQESGFIRIPVGKVDGLMDMLGELLILNSQFSQLVDEGFGSNTTMSNTLSRTSKLIKEIQALSMSLRMVEIRPTLHRLHRIARETAAELNKKVLVVIEGEETEIDRSAAEKIFDPLMHLVRNAVSHGIEEEEERIKSQKNPEGKLVIKAYSKRGNVYFEISEDGRGIDTKKILKKAIDLNMAEENKEYSEEEIIKFIFKPGFSTQEKINNISGRGVGMNVVEDVITQMGGKIDISNNLGYGCTFSVRIPMNLAVVNGTIVEVAGGRYIIPTLYIKEFFIIDDRSYISINGKTEALRVRDKVIPVINASKIFDMYEADALVNRREIIILELDQKLLAFPVDRILARQEIVSKPLDSEFASITYASGAAILGDGNVSLILDAEAIFKMSEL